MHGRNLSQPMVCKYICIVQCSHFLTGRHSVYNLLQFFQWLVLFQCSGQSYGYRVSQTIVSEAAVGYTDMNTLELDPQFHIKQIPCCHVAMTTPHHQRRQWYWYGLQLEMTHFMWPYTYRHATITKTCYNTQQNVQLKWLPILVAIATDHVFTSNTESPCFCCYWQLLTTNGAGIRLQFLLFTGIHSVRNVTVATSTSLPSPRRSHRGHCHLGQLYHVHILCILGLYKAN